MATFNVKSRVTGPLTTATIDAVNREAAIDQIIQGLGDGETVEILQVDDASIDAVNPTVAAKR